MLDLVFMSFYAVGTFTSGMLGSAAGASPVRLMLLGLAVSAAVTAGAFPCADLTGWAPPQQMGLLVPLWAVNGLAQASTWPAVVDVMGRWFPPNQRGVVFGLWAGNAMVGDVVGSLGVAAMLGASISWQWCFVAGGAAMAGTSVLLHCLLQDAPPADAQHMRSPVNTGTKPDVALGRNVRSWTDSMHDTSEWTSESRAVRESVTEMASMSPHTQGGASVQVGSIQPSPPMDALVLPATAGHASRQQDSHLDLGSAASTQQAAATASTIDAWEEADAETGQGHSAPSQSSSGRMQSPLLRSAGQDRGLAAPPSQPGIDGSRAVSELGAWGRFCGVLSLPGALEFCLCYAAIKATDASLFFWLPLALSEADGFSAQAADDLSTLYAAGGVLAVFFTGWILDSMGHAKQATVSLVNTALAVVALALLRVLAGDAGAPVAGSTAGVAGLIAFVGIGVGGPVNLISSVVAADLGDRARNSGAGEVTAMATGLVNGGGAVATAAMQVLLPLVQTAVASHYGSSSAWDTVFAMLAALSGVAMLCLIPAVVRECKVLGSAAPISSNKT